MIVFTIKLSFILKSKIFLGMQNPWKLMIFAELNLGSVRWEDLSARGALALRGEALTNLDFLVLLDQAKRT